MVTTFIGWDVAPMPHGEKYPLHSTCTCSIGQMVSGKHSNIVQFFEFYEDSDMKHPRSLPLVQSMGKIQMGALPAKTGGFGCSFTESGTLASICLQGFCGRDDPFV
jgi:hypothetical protein